jgi:hypothetical protein
MMGSRHCLPVACEAVSFWGHRQPTWSAERTGQALLVKQSALHRRCAACFSLACPGSVYLMVRCPTGPGDSWNFNWWSGILVATLLWYAAAGQSRVSCVKRVMLLLCACDWVQVARCM